MGTSGQHETHLDTVLIYLPFFVSIPVLLFFDGLSSSYQTKLYRSSCALTSDQLSQHILSIRNVYLCFTRSSLYSYFVGYYYLVSDNVIL